MDRKVKDLQNISYLQIESTVLLLTADVELCECYTLTATVKILASYQLQIAGDIWRLESRWTSCVTPIHVFFFLVYILCCESPECFV